MSLQIGGASPHVHIEVAVSWKELLGLLKYLLRARSYKSVPVMSG